ncbi:acyltransferase [Marinomonas sp. S3726]|uniref:acyltransferase n=1 Tax=Marinomonas sp. S3726 TaxID=579484 RepID=UPI002356DAE9|nr:acyltransferase [Marinomonas sp. S3726]
MRREDLFAGSLALTWHHAIGDMQTFMSFMRAWSDQFAGRHFVTPLIVPDRHQYLAQHLPRNNNQDEAAVRKIGIVEAIKLIYYMQCKRKAQRWVQFYFSEDELKTMHENYRQRSDRFLSVNDALSAHILSVFTDTLEHKGQLYPREMDMAINFRSRAGLDKSLMGNMVSTVKISHIPGDSAVKLAQGIRHKVEHFENEHLDYYASLEYIEKHGGRDKIAQFIPDWLNPYGNSLLLTSWANFGVYDIDFGVERPFYFATMGPALFPWISNIVEGPNNTGLSYVVSVPKSVSDDTIKNTLLGKINQFRKPDEVIPELVRSMTIG